MDLGLGGRTYLITGGSRGLGRAAAQALVAEGANVVVSARDADALSRTVGELGPRAAAVPGDLADPDTGQRLVAVADERFGRLDGCLISVGGPPPGSPMTTSDEDWRRAFESVFLGAVRMVRIVADRVGSGVAPGIPDTGPALPSGGRPDDRPGSGPAILLVLSTSARSPIPGLTASNGLRPGLGMLVKDFADELGPRGIRMNAVLPGRIATDRTRQLDQAKPDPEAARKRNEALIPLGRYGQPDELGRVAAFLLSPAASYVNGSLIPVDGGSMRAI